MISAFTPADALRDAVRIAIRYDSASGGEPEVWRCWPGGAEEVLADPLYFVQPVPRRRSA